MPLQMASRAVLFLTFLELQLVGAKKKLFVLIVNVLLFIL